MATPIIFNKYPPANPDALQLYSFATPNGMKLGIALEELGLEYEAHLVDIGKGDQFSVEYKSLSPNSKIPTLLDPKGPDGEPLPIMESAAILLYLAEKAGGLMPTDAVGRMECLQWLFFQVGHIGPMFGQFGHFFKFAREKCTDPYPLERYTNETKRLLGVLEERLKSRPNILGEDYSICDIAIFPWVHGLFAFYKAQEQLGLDGFPSVGRWYKACMDRPATVRGMKVCAPN